jgi:hypothetical protein
VLGTTAVIGGVILVCAFFMLMFARPEDRLDQSPGQTT